MGKLISSYVKCAKVEYERSIWKKKLMRNRNNGKEWHPEHSVTLHSLVGKDNTDLHTVSLSITLYICLVRYNSNIIHYTVISESHSSQRSNTSRYTSPSSSRWIKVSNVTMVTTKLNCYTHLYTWSLLEPESCGSCARSLPRLIPAKATRCTSFTGHSLMNSRH